MIREITRLEFDKVYDFIKKDSARNYFIRLGFDSNKAVYDKIFVELDERCNLGAVLLKRKSGNLQFYAKNTFDVDTFSQIMRKLDFKSLISPSSYCDEFLGKGIFTDYKNGAIIAKLSLEGTSIEYENHSEVRPLQINDLDKVVDLYKKVFNGFSSKSVMEEKLKLKRGRGICIYRDDELISVAQSEFEMKDSAIIVGVATDPEYQGMGLASKCLNILCSQLVEEGKDLYLQYDNMDAGRIYERIGFKPIDQVKHYIK